MGEHVNNKLSPLSIHPVNERVEANKTAAMRDAGGVIEGLIMCVQHTSATGHQCPCKPCHVMSCHVMVTYPDPFAPPGYHPSTRYCLTNAAFPAVTGVAIYNVI